MRSPNFLGQAYQARSKNLADQLCINLYLNPSESPGAKDQGVLYGTPGLDLAAALPTAPVRGEHPFQNVLYVVAGSTVYSLDQAFNVTTLGTILSAAGPLSWIDNGTQTAFFDGSNGYLVPGGQPLTGGTIGSGVAATGDLVFALNPTNTQTIILDGVTWTFVSSGASGTQTNIGVSLAATLTQLQLDLTASGNASIALASYAVTSTQLNITYNTGGTAGNGYTLAGGTSGATSSGATLTGGIDGGGANYNVDDTITLVDAAGSTSPATAQLTVTTVSGGVVTGFSINMAGAFVAALPTSFVQAASSGGGSGFTLASPTFGASVGVYKIPLPFSVPLIANYEDGFGVCVEAGTTTVWQSNLFDLSVWDPLNFSDVEARPTNLVSIGFLHRQLVMLQERTAEVWINTGSTGFVFAEEQGVHIETGCVAPYSVAQAGESLIWLAQNAEGRNYVVQMQGYEPVEISTDAIEYAMAQYPTVSDAIAYAYRMEKRVFYVLTFPSANATWACEVSGRTRLWHQWLYFSNGAYSRHRSNCGVFFAGKTIVGDYQSGNLYALNLDTYTDNGQSIRRTRSWRALGAPTETPVRFKYLWIDMQSGVGVAEDDNPQMMLDYSDDGGHTWSAERFGAAGKTGEYGQRVKFNRLGSTARDQGEDRIWRIATSDQFAVALIGAWQG